MDEFRRLDVMIQLEQVACERCGMVAENMQREHRGEQVAYVLEDFNRLIAWLEELRNAIRD